MLTNKTHCSLKATDAQSDSSGNSDTIIPFTVASNVADKSFAVFYSMWVRLIWLTWFMFVALFYGDLSKLCLFHLSLMMEDLSPFVTN